jgi:4-hydroxy-2-oxoheptanedioate aldolase
MEHTSLSLEDVEHMAKAAALSGMTLQVRVPKEDGGLALRALDIGAKGIVFPHVNTKVDAQRSVDITKYSPIGHRGLSASKKTVADRADYATHCKLANEDVITTLLVEEGEGVNNISEILSVKGFDAIDTGPTDLWQSLGMKGDKNSPHMVEALEKVYEACTNADMPVVISASFGDERIRNWVKKGTRIILELGSDDRIIADAFRRSMFEADRIVQLMS